MTPPDAAKPKRLDERVAPGWANLCANLLRGGGILVGLLLLWLGFVTGGFFLVLTGVLAALALGGGWLLASLITRESWHQRPNARQLTFAIVIAYPLALVALAQLVGPALIPPPAQSACFADRLGRTEQRAFAWAVDPRITEMQFTLEVRELQGGAVRWFVTDPNGQSQWSGRTEESGFTQTAAVEPAGGQWVVNVVSEADVVEFGIDWQAGSPGQPMAPTEPCAPSS